MYFLALGKVDNNAAPHSLTGFPWTASEVKKEDAKEPR